MENLLFLPIFSGMIHIQKLNIEEISNEWNYKF